ncbi:hypothetical protein [Microbulbifer sp. GL-2]|uniref:hypothetical protein n=1 Tax=Microbulbifer sp. GL-2 TaxID=2591606 RepID=UPI0011648CFC|nr:hypothetical protein [Microbulbifer sp. GL-2]BBM01287.1 hypothetical protein GL2_13610 [Microbulbifer sp. GL-2]
MTTYLRVVINVWSAGSNQVIGYTVFNPDELLVNSQVDGRISRQQVIFCLIGIVDPP